MGERGKVNTALTILGVTGCLIIYSAIDSSFEVHEGVWGVATLAAAFLFTTGKRNGNGNGNGGG